MFIAVGFVLQQHAAAQEPPDERLRLALITHLVRRPLWMGGIAAMATGQILGAVALGKGSLALVEPITAGNLLFALPMSALWHRHRLGWREWGGSVALVAGLALFIGAGNPHGGSTARLPWPNWVISGGTIAALAAILVVAGRRTQAARTATLLASAAGVLYGLQDALTKRTMDELNHGIASTIVSWPVFTLIAVAAVGLFLAQSAFEAAPLAASLPAMTVAEPLTGIAFGVGVYGQYLDLAPPQFALELLGMAAMVAGVFMVAGSPIVTKMPAAASRTEMSGDREAA